MNTAAVRSGHAMTVGDKGRVVLPAELRERHDWGPGSKLVAIDTEFGALVVSADDALAWLRERLAGRDVLGELFADRRAEARREGRGPA